MKPQMAAEKYGGQITEARQRQTENRPATAKHAKDAKKKMGHLAQRRRDAEDAIINHPSSIVNAYRLRPVPGTPRHRPCPCGPFRPCRPLQELPMPDGFIPPHGGYTRLLSYRKAEIIYDATAYFCDRFFERRDRLAERDKQ